MDSFEALYWTWCAIWGGELAGLLTALGTAAIGGLVGAVIGKQRDRVAVGAILGVLAGPIGWLLVYFGPDDRPKCRECKGVIDIAARRCPHCGIDFNAPRQRSTPPPELAAASSVDPPRRRPHRPHRPTPRRPLPRLKRPC